MNDHRKKLFVVSLGCAKAQVDAEAGIGQLIQQGYVLVDSIEEADTAVVNTCGFIEPAIRESVDTIVELADMKDAGDLEELVVSGCLVDRFSEDLLQELPEVDRFVASGAFREWSTAASAGRKILESPGTALPTSSDTRVLLNASHYAYVKIAEGCDRSCSFCTIPSIRGKQQSRSVDDILAELKLLSEQGVKEALLVSQDTVRWGRDREPRESLEHLLQQIETTEHSPDWVRLHYLYPEKFTPELIQLIANSQRILPYVDVPIQHASDKVLTTMRRAHRQADIRNLVNQLRDANPDISIRTTVIVGHPGETQDDVNDLCDLLDDLKFDAVGIFTYWDEEGTISHSLPDHVDAGEQQIRAAAVEDVAREASEWRAAQKVGQSMRVLVDGIDPIEGQGWIGRHAGQAPDVDSVVMLPRIAGPPGGFLDVTIKEAEGFNLVGEPTTPMEVPTLV